MSFFLRFLVLVSVGCLSCEAVQLSKGNEPRIEHSTVHVATDLGAEEDVTLTWEERDVNALSNVVVWPMSNQELFAHQMKGMSLQQAADAMESKFLSASNEAQSLAQSEESAADLRGHSDARDAKEEDTQSSSLWAAPGDQELRLVDSQEQPVVSDQPPVDHVLGMEAGNPMRRKLLDTLKKDLRIKTSVQMCLQVDLSLYAFVPGLQVSVGVSGTVGYDKTTSCFAWTLEAHLTLQYGLKVFGYGLGVGVTIGGAVDMQEEPDQRARDSEFGSGLRWTYGHRAPRQDPAKCSSSSPWPALLAYIKRAHVHAMSSKDVQDKISASLQDIEGSVAVKAFNTYRTLLSQYDPQAGIKHLDKPAQPVDDTTLRHKAQQWLDELTGNDATSWFGVDKVVRDTRNLPDESPLRGFAQPLSTAAQGVAAGMQLFLWQAPHLAQQIMDRLVDNSDKFGMDGYISWWSSRNAGQRLTYSSGRFLARWPGTAHTLGHDLDVPGAHNTVDGRTLNFAKVARLSEHRDSADFWREYAISASNLFIRSVGDFQALWNIYMANDPSWDGSCLSLEAKFQLPHEFSRKHGTRVSESTNRLDASGATFESTGGNPFHQWHWTSRATQTDLPQSAEFLRTHGDIHDSALPSYPGTMFPLLWCRSATMRSDGTSKEEEEDDDPSSAEESDDEQGPVDAVDIEPRAPASILPTLDGLRLRVQAACSEVSADGTRVEPRWECEETVLSKSFISIHSNFAAKLVRNLKTIERKLLEINACTGRSFALNVHEDTRLRELVAPRRASKTRAAAFAFVSPTCKTEESEKDDCRSSRNWERAQEFAEKVCLSRAAACVGYTIVKSNSRYVGCVHSKMTVQSTDEVTPEKSQLLADFACFERRDARLQRMALKFRAAGLSRFIGVEGVEQARKDGTLEAVTASTLEEYMNAEERRTLVEGVLTPYGDGQCDMGGEQRMNQVKNRAMQVVEMVERLAVSMGGGADPRSTGVVLKEMQKDVVDKYGLAKGAWWSRLQAVTPHLFDHLESYQSHTIERLKQSRTDLALGSIPGIVLPAISWSDALEVQVHLMKQGLCTSLSSPLLIGARHVSSGNSWTKESTVENCFYARIQPMGVYFQLFRCSGEHKGVPYVEWRARYQASLPTANLSPVIGKLTGFDSLAQWAFAAAITSGAASAAGEFIASQAESVFLDSPIGHFLVRVGGGEPPLSAVGLSIPSIESFGDFKQAMAAMVGALVAQKILSARSLSERCKAFGVDVTYGLTASAMTVAKDLVLLHDSPLSKSSHMRTWQGTGTLSVKSVASASMVLLVPAVVQANAFLHHIVEVDFTPWLTDVDSAGGPAQERVAACKACLDKHEGFCDLRPALGSAWSVALDACHTLNVNAREIENENESTSSDFTFTKTACTSLSVVQSRHVDPVSGVWIDEAVDTCDSLASGSF